MPEFRRAGDPSSFHPVALSHEASASRSKLVAPTFQGAEWKKGQRRDQGSWKLSQDTFAYAAGDGDVSFVRANSRAIGRRSLYFGQL